MERYRGLEDVREVDQVVRYLVDNYVDENGERVSDAMALGLCDHDLAWEMIQTSVGLRSHVAYVGDLIADRAGLNELDDDEENDDEPDE